MYERTVITTGRRAAKPGLDRFLYTRADVEALSAKLGEPGWLLRRRLEAWEKFESLPMPTVGDEAWRRTDLRSLRAGEFALAAPNGNGRAKKKVPASLLKPLVGKAHGGQLVVNHARTESLDLQDSIRRQGVVFADWPTAVREHADLLQAWMGRAVPFDEGKFSALADALTHNGVFVYVPKGVAVELPLHSVVFNSGTREALFTHVLLVVDDGASLTHVHETASPTESTGQALHAGVVELLLGQAAQLKFVELQSWGEHVWNFTHERARVGRDSSLDWIFSAAGSHVTKNFSELDLDGEGATGRMSGFYFADGEQHLDHDTQQNHNAPHTTSDLLFKGALKDKSRSVWQGMIYVAPGAQKTDGYQANRNLVLSKAARADSIPGLEILADDVRCTHGATVGQLEEEHVFYLMARGLPRKDAERLVVDGFFDPIMQRIPFEGVRERLKKGIDLKMD